MIDLLYSCRWKMRGIRQVIFLQEITRSKGHFHDMLVELFMVGTEFRNRLKKSVKEG